jgi:hypothetical protein
MHVSLSALEGALRFVEDLANTDDPTDLGRRALPGLGRLVRSDVLTYNELRPGTGQASYYPYPEDVVFSPDSMAAFAVHMHENPLISHLQCTGGGSPMMISDFLSQQDFHRLGVYTEFYRQVPVEHQLAFGLPPSDGRVIGIALNRGRSDFTEDDRDLLAVLRAPLVRATSRARSRHRARQALTGPDDGQLAGLTSRELQLLELVAMGRTNTAIARCWRSAPGRLPTTSTTSTASWTSPAAPPLFTVPSPKAWSPPETAAAAKPMAPGPSGRGSIDSAGQPGGMYFPWRAGISGRPVMRPGLATSVSSA